MQFNFDGLVKKEEPEVPKYVGNVYKSMCTTVDDIIKMLYSQDPAVIDEVIRMKLSVILDEIFNKLNKPLFTAFWSDAVLLQLPSIIPTMDIKVRDRYHLNKFMYDYFIYDELRMTNPNQWEKMNRILYQVSLALNKDAISKLRACTSEQLEEELASHIVVARYSTDNITKAVKRIHTTMFHWNVLQFTEQLMVDIYINLFDRISPLFIGIMSDYRDMRRVGLNESEFWGTIDLAILNILENMPSSEIEKVYRDYREALKFGIITKPKFNILSSNSIDYGRTMAVIERVLSEDKEPG